MTAFFNTGLSQEQFLQQYWQKKPLLIRQAFPDFVSPVTPDELAGLACEADIESRLIEQKDLQGLSWQVTAGPLDEDNFARLPETHWTLLVQDVDKHLPELQTLLDPFSFIPDWRRDDLMISYAPESGSVGPHTDAYDVFLLQAMGVRRWQVGNHAIHEAKIIAGLELQILAEFNPGQSWDLLPGDLLYLPPYFAHHGVALNECMTFSFGFRAPLAVELLDKLVNSLLEQGLDKLRYQDPELCIGPYGAEIDSDALTRVQRMLHQSIDHAGLALATALGKFVSETKPSLEGLVTEASTAILSIDELEMHFQGGNVLQRNPYVRFAWVRSDIGGLLFMAGDCYSVGFEGVVNLPILTEKHTLNHANWIALAQDEISAKLLCQLIAEGGWYWQSTAE